MNAAGTVAVALGALLLSLGTGCGSSGPAGESVTFTPLHPWDGGPDAACVIGTSSTRVGCAVAYSVTGNPYECAGFDDGGLGVGGYLPG